MICVSKRFITQNTNRPGRIAKMQLIGLGVVAAVLIVGAALRNRTEKIELIRYTSKDGRYSVLFPPDPVKSSESIDSEFGTVIFHTIQKQAGEYNFQTGYADFTLDDTKGHTTENILKSNRDLIVNIGAEVIQDKTVDMAGHKAHLITIRNSEATMHVKLTVIDNRLYRILASTPPEETDNPAITRMFDSFEIEAE